MGVWTNGDSISKYHRKEPNYFEDISDIPNAHQKLNDILEKLLALNLERAALQGESITSSVESELET